MVTVIELIVWIWVGVFFGTFMLLAWHLWTANALTILGFSPERRTIQSRVIRTSKLLSTKGVKIVGTDLVWNRGDKELYIPLRGGWVYPYKRGQLIRVDIDQGLPMPFDNITKGQIKDTGEFMGEAVQRKDIERINQYKEDLWAKLAKYTPIIALFTLLLLMYVAYSVSKIQPTQTAL